MARRGSLGLPAQMLVLLGAAAVLGTGAQVLSPTRIPWREDWSHFVQTKALRAGIPLANVDEVSAIVEARNTLVLDARPLTDYDAGHIPGAMSLPDTQLDEAYPQLAPLLTPSQPILVYCSGHECDESLHLSLYLHDQGFTNVALFVGGFTDWIAAGRPVER